MRFKLTAALAFLLIHIPSVFAQGFGRGDVELTKPVGGDVLPGGELTGDIKTSFIFSKLIPFAIKYAIGLAIALAVIALIIGGYQYMTAYGSDEKHKNAQKTITYALIGLILALTAFGIVQIITSIQLT